MSKKISSLVVPNELGYIESVIAYSNNISKRVGFSEREIQEISIAVKEACENVITHAFELHEDESFTITFEILNDGLKIIIDEMGLPFLPALDKQIKESPGLHAMEKNMDNVLYVNKGKDGKELQLIKYLKGKHIADLFSEDELTPYDFCEIPPDEITYTVRLMKQEETIKVARCIYRTYRYSYLNEDLYFPERIGEKNRDGRMISAVAVTNEDKLVAHFSLFPRPNGKVAEIGAAVVIPQHRRRGLMRRLLEYLITVAEKRGLIALYGDAFSMHTISQNVNLKFGMRETALQLGVVPPKSIGIMTEKGLGGAGNVITFYKYLKEPEAYEVFLPPQHSDILKTIYENLGITRLFGSFNKPLAEQPADESEIHLSFKPLNKEAFIEVIRLGQDLERRIKAKLLELTNKGFNAVFVDLNLKDPLTLTAIDMLEEIGFFFSGLLPDYSNGDILRLQYYNTIVDYSEIEVFSPFAVELVEYVKGLDPKWKVLHS
jgi:anti-sigma regulatory factor (Ser/Thr protein kinase)/GNAT superfamily N-acetyltransferase